MDNQLLALLQIGDSNFPSGAFSHSFGLETYIQEETVYSKETFLNGSAFTWKNNWPIRMDLPAA